MREYHSKNDNLPTTWEIASHFGWASNTGAVNHIRSMVRKGWLEKVFQEGKQRYTALRFSRQ